MIEVEKQTYIIPCSCNSCRGKNYGDNPVDLYDIRFFRVHGNGGMVVTLCRECALELVRGIGESIGTKSLFSCPYCSNFLGRL